MRFVTFEVKTLVGPVQRIGILQDQHIVDLHGSYGAYLKEVRRVWRWQELATNILPPDMLKFIEGGPVSREAVPYALEYAGKHADITTDESFGKLHYQLAEVKLLAPVPRPVSIRDCTAFPQHSMNMQAARQSGETLPEVWFKIPAHYRTSSTDVVGPDAPILWPSYTEKLDYELEVALCIGKYGVNIPAEKAEEFIFGYTVFNDISARDFQGKEMSLKLGPTKAKSFRNSNIMGPCLVTPDEIDANNLRMVARVNGEVWSDGNTRDMHFKFPQLITHLSKDDPVYPGEFIGSGTIGFGSGMELDRWIKPGDVVELEVEGIGILRNRVERHT